MNFVLKEGIDMLEKTPATLATFLIGISKGWLETNEGDGTWNAIQVVDHLIEGEKVNWIPRLKMILQEGENAVFPVFDRDSHLHDGASESLEVKLEEFAALRSENIRELKELLLQHESALDRTGLHPAFGKVTARELVSTWVVHDMTHLSQIVRVFSQRYREDVGPWKEYLGVLNLR